MTISIRPVMSISAEPPSHSRTMEAFGRLGARVDCAISPGGTESTWLKLIPAAANARAFAWAVVSLGAGVDVVLTRTVVVTLREETVLGTVVLVVESTEDDWGEPHAARDMIVARTVAETNSTRT